MLDKREHLKQGRWCWIVQNENEHEQHRIIGLFLSFDDLGDAWMVTKQGDKFETGVYSVKDLIPLNNCTGWHYYP